jgi:kumamolisin
MAGVSRHVLPVLTAGCLVAVGLGVPTTASAQEGRLSAVLSLATTPGDRARLHQLASLHPSPASLRALAPAAAHRDAALRFAADEHLRVVRADAWTVTLSGPAGAMAAAFGTTLHDSRTGTWAPDPAVPAALAKDVGNVVGLDNRPFHRRHATLDGADNPQTPASLRAAYDVPTAWRGAGVTVGVLNLAGWSPNDLSTFAQHEGIPLAPGQVTEVSVDGADPRQLDGYGGELEPALDAEAVLGAAPEAKQRMYFTANTSAGVVSAFQAMAADAEAGLLQVVSTSWGICERTFDAMESQADRDAYAAAIDRLVAAGATLFAASGDAGAYDCSYPDQPDGEAQVDFPASYVNTVAVGGTTLTAGQDETAWHDQGLGDWFGFASGGGESVDQPLPSHQAGLVPGASRRLVPDVAGDADPQSGLRIYVRSQGGWITVGGTSLASPTWAGMLASALSSQPGTPGLGNVLPALYASAQDLVSPGFTDITTGHNALFGAGPGYDQVTGLGVPQWGRLGPSLLASTRGVPASGAVVHVDRPPRSVPPTFVVGAYTRSATVPVSVGVASSSPYQGFSTGEALPGCAYQQPAPPTVAHLGAQPWQGKHDLLLAALDSAHVCHVVVATVVYDTVAPTTTVSAGLVNSTNTQVRIVLGGTDGTSGLGLFEVRVWDSTGRGVLHTTTTARSVVRTLSAGKSYRIEAVAHDRAGNAGPVARTTVSVPFDDTAYRLGGAWTRVSGSRDFRGSHLTSRNPAATATVVVTGRVVYVLALRGPASGYVDVVVDGRRTQRWDLYAAGTTAARLRAAVWSRPGRHTVQLVVVGAHRRGSAGSHVALDGVTVLP